MKNPPVTSNSSGPGTIVGSNVALTGTLKDDDDIAVYGMVEGEVLSEKTVTVGQTAQVKGPIRAAFVTIAGTVRGSVDASDKLEILETGKVFGSVNTKDLVIRSGAIFIGDCKMPSDEVNEAAAEPTIVANEEPKQEAQKTDDSLPQPDEE